MSQQDDQDMGGLTVKEFCKLYKRSKSEVYKDINAGRLKARKVSKQKTILLKPDIREWERSLPVIGSR
jgi:hypothetical protein